MCHGPGVQVVAVVPVAGPVPPPIMVVTPLISASSTCCGQMKWMCASMRAGGQDQALAGDHLGAGADDDGDAGWMSGLPALPIAGDAAVLDADVGLDDAPVIEDHRVGDDRVDHLGRDALALAHAVADHLAAAEFDFLAVDRVIALDLDHELGVAEAHAVAGGGTVHLGIGAPLDLRHDSGPMMRP